MTPHERPPEEGDDKEQQEDVYISDVPEEVQLRPDSKLQSVTPIIDSVPWKTEQAPDADVTTEPRRPGQTGDEAAQEYWRNYGEAGSDKNVKLPESVWEIPTEDDRDPDPNRDNNVIEGPWKQPGDDKKE